MAGGDQYRKGYKEVMSSAEKLIANNKKVKLRIAGNVVIEKKHQYLVQTGVIQLVGYISGKEKLKIFKGSDIFLLPTNAEGFPNSVIEAMASKLPIISSNISQISCIIEDGKEGLLVPLGDSKALYKAILKLYNNKKLRDKLSSFAYKKAIDLYDIKKLNTYFCKIYD